MPWKSSPHLFMNILCFIPNKCVFHCAKHRTLHHISYSICHLWDRWFLLFFYLSVCVCLCVHFLVCLSFSRSKRLRGRGRRNVRTWSISSYRTRSTGAYVLTFFWHCLNTAIYYEQNFLDLSPEAPPHYPLHSSVPMHYFQSIFRTPCYAEYLSHS